MGLIFRKRVAVTRTARVNVPRHGEGYSQLIL
jgi:hypothetical protein